MTLSHVPDFYMDGYIAIPYCKVCSAEGDKLFETCSGPIQKTEAMIREDFEKNFPRAAKLLDAGNKTAK